MWWTLGWLVIGVAALVLEAFALANSTRGDTLSEHVWTWLGVRVRGTPHRTAGAGVRVARFVLAAGLLWLAVHFLTGGWW